VAKRKEEKNKKNKTMIQIILQGILKIEQHEPHMKSGGEFRCSGMVSCSFSLVTTIMLLFTYPGAKS
jgi:hypothetical protein